MRPPFVPAARMLPFAPSMRSVCSYSDWVSAFFIRKLCTISPIAPLAKRSIATLVSSPCMSANRCGARRARPRSPRRGSFAASRGRARRRTSSSRRQPVRENQGRSVLNNSSRKQPRVICASAGLPIAPAAIKSRTRRYKGLNTSFSATINVTPAFSAARDHRVGLGQRRGQGLLAQHVLAASDRFEAYPRVEMVRKADVHRVQIAIVERLAEVGGRAGACPQARHCPRPRRMQVDRPSDGDPWLAREGACVTRAGPSASDDSHREGSHGVSRGGRDTTGVR